MLANLMSLEPSDPSLHEGLHILVAEDSSITQDLLKLVLQQRGHSVDIVEDGAQALAALSKTAFDLVLLDFHLPKMNGMEVLTNYLNYPRVNSRPRFVAVTADVEGLLMQKQDGVSFDQIVSKPLNIQEILSIIDEEIDKKREDVSSSTERMQATIQPIEPPSSVAAPPKIRICRWRSHSSLAQGFRPGWCVDRPSLRNKPIRPCLMPSSLTSRQEHRISPSFGKGMVCTCCHSSI